MLSFLQSKVRKKLVNLFDKAFIILIYLVDGNFPQYRKSKHIYSDKFVLTMYIITEDVSKMNGVVDEMFKYESNTLDRFVDLHDGYKMIEKFLELGICRIYCNQNPIYINCELESIGVYNKKLRKKKLKSILN